MAVQRNMQAKTPMLSGNPSRQATKNTVPTGKGMPKMSPGKPGKSITGKPASVPVNKATRQPKGGGIRVSGSSIKGAPKRSANALNGKQSRRGRINPADLGI